MGSAGGRPRTVISPNQAQEWRLPFILLIGSYAYRVNTKRRKRARDRTSLSCPRVLQLPGHHGGLVLSVGSVGTLSRPQ